MDYSGSWRQAGHETGLSREEGLHECVSIVEAEKKVENAKGVDEVACVAAANEAITSIDATATLEVLV